MGARPAIVPQHATDLAGSTTRCIPSPYTSTEARGAGKAINAQPRDNPCFWLFSIVRRPMVAMDGYWASLTPSNTGSHELASSFSAAHTTRFPAARHLAA